MEMGKENWLSVINSVINDEKPLRFKFGERSRSRKSQSWQDS